jgi:hypothetical protein
MAEVTTKTIQGIASFPQGNSPIQLVYVSGTSAINNDTITVNNLTTVLGSYLVSTTGVAGTLTFATNVITVTNGGALSWNGLVWGI